MRLKYRIDKRGVHQFIGRPNRCVSVRVPSKIYDIVMEYEGKTFSEKLINLIFDYKEFHDLKRNT